MQRPTAYPLTWPLGFGRTRQRQRAAFRVTLTRALADLHDALRLFGDDTGNPVQNVVVSSDCTLGVSRPGDPGVAVYFDWCGAGRCIAADRYSTVQDNVRAIYYVLEARRQEMRHGGLEIVRAAFAGFVALPAPKGWRSVLGLGPGASIAEAEAAYRNLALRNHPDIPEGSAEAMAAINLAISAARSELAEDSR